MTNHRTIMAANNNVDWYNMMFDIQGLRHHRSEIAFLGIRVARGQTERRYGESAREEEDDK